MKKVLFFVTLFLGFWEVGFAEDSLSVKCDSNKVNVGQQIICRLSAESSEAYNEVNYTIELGEGLSLVDTRSNYNGLWNVSDVKASASREASGLQEFGILLIKADDFGEFNLTVKNITLGVSNSSNFREIKEVSSNIKVISKDNYLTGIKINGEEIENFDKNTLNYSYETKDEELEIEVIKNDEFAIVSGDGKVKISNNSAVTFIPIKVKSESNAVRYYIIEVKNTNFKDNKINKSLDDVIIKDGKDNLIDFGFKKDVYYYSIEVDKNIDSINIVPKVSAKNLSLVKSFAGGKNKIEDGLNVFIVKVKDEEGQIVNYLFNITRPIDSLSSNSYLSELNVKGYDIKFNKRVKNYNLEINRRDHKLDIDVKLDDENSFYKIVGNENLKKGSVVKIVVTAQDASSTVYTINISIKKFNFMSLIKYVVIVLGCYLVYKNKDKFVIKLEKLSYEKLLIKYNSLFENKGITKNFLKLSENVRKDILVYAIKNNKLANKTDLYKNATKELTKTTSKKEVKKKVKPKSTKKK